MTIIAKKWEPRNPIPGPFSAQIRKVEARLGKLEVRPKKKKRKKGPHLVLVGGQESWATSFGKLGKFSWKIGKKLGKFIRKNGKKLGKNRQIRKKAKLAGQETFGQIRKVQ